MAMKAPTMRCDSMRGALSFAPGEAYQFDWSHEIVLINGTTVTVKVAHDHSAFAVRDEVMQRLVGSLHAPWLHPRRYRFAALAIAR